MIELSGLDPDRDIAIEVVGRRPGEKLTRSCSTPTSDPSPPRPRRSCAPSVSRCPDLVDGIFDAIGLLVLEGDAAGLAAKVSELSANAEVRRLGFRRLSGPEATPVISARTRSTIDGAPS